MASDYLKLIPGPLLEDLKKNKWLPIIGAGFSLNANIPDGKEAYAWNGLGRVLHEDLPEHDYNNALDSISAYSHAFSRARLVERLYELLLIDEAKPGDAHKSFCQVPFDVVVTTNFDFLLERQYENLGRPCTPVVSEDQLSVNIGESVQKLAPRTSLLKLHGDLNHPSMLVVTEEDYEGFIERRPLICTHLGDLLIKRTAVLVGYSLDDSDLRQLWRVISNRLGFLRRPAYAIMVDADTATTARYERRGVRIINLPGSKNNYGNILAALFNQIHEMWVNPDAKKATPPAPTSSTKKPGGLERFCFISTPSSSRESLLIREAIVPEVYKADFEPIFVQDVITPGANISATIEKLIARSSIAIIVLGNDFSLWESKIAENRLGKDRVFLINDHIGDIGIAAHEARNFEVFGNWDDNSSPVAALRKWLSTKSDEIPFNLIDEPQKLYEFKMYSASVIATIASIEALIRRRLIEADYLGDRRSSVLRMAEIALKKQVFDQKDFEQLRNIASIRNLAAHGQKDATKQEAASAIAFLKSLLAKK